MKAQKGYYEHGRFLLWRPTLTGINQKGLQQKFSGVCRSWPVRLRVNFLRKGKLFQHAGGHQTILLNLKIVLFRSWDAPDLPRPCHEHLTFTCQTVWQKSDPERAHANKKLRLKATMKGFSHTILTLSRFNHTMFPKSNPESTNYSAIDNANQSISKHIDDISMNMIDNSMGNNETQIEFHHEEVQPYGIHPEHV